MHLVVPTLGAALAWWCAPLSFGGFSFLLPLRSIPMVQRIAVIALSLGLAAAPAAFADNGKQAEVKKAPKATKMSDAQLDKVSAGALINAFVVDVVDVQNVDVAVAIPVNAAVAANVLGGAAGAASLQQPGRIRQ